MGQCSSTGLGLRVRPTKHFTVSVSASMRSISAGIAWITMSFDQYTNQGKRSYIPIPFFISSRGYGFWLKTERQAQFDLAADSNCWW